MIIDLLWKEYVQDNYYAKFDSCSYHSCGKIVLMLGSTRIVDMWTYERKDGGKSELLCHTLLKAGATKSVDQKFIVSGLNKCQHQNM